MHRSDLIPFRVVSAPARVVAMFKHLILLMLFLSWPAFAAAPPVQLAGTLTLMPYSNLDGGLLGWEYTYSESGLENDVTGLIVLPAGAGPFPVAVLAHGKGGNAVGFGSVKSNEWFGPNGYMTISMDLTHAGEVFCMDQTNQCGGSPENIQRAETAVFIAISQNLIDQVGNVADRDNVFLYGNSIGATTALELAEKLGSRFRAVALSAGGILLNSKLAYMTPSGSNGVANVVSPLLQMHGRLDGVIKPNEAEALVAALDQYDKVHQTVWFHSGGHNIATAQNSTYQVGSFILDWFDAYRMKTIPRITNLSPGRGKIGAAVRLMGSNLGTNPGNSSSVTFAGVKAAPTSWSPTSIVTKVPEGAITGSVQVTVPVGPVTDAQVEQPVGGGMRSNRVTFTVTP